MHSVAEYNRSIRNDADVRLADHFSQLRQGADKDFLILVELGVMASATRGVVSAAEVWADTCMGLNDDEDLYGVELRMVADIMSDSLESTCREAVRAGVPVESTESC